MRALHGISATLTALALTTLPGCPDRTVAVLEPEQAGELSKDIPVTVELDLLFVIDDSGSTRDKQTVFAANFPRFIEALEGFAEGLPNLHIGVVSTTVDLGVSNVGGCPRPASADNGLLHNEPFQASCAPLSGRFIVDNVDAFTGDRRRNYTGDLDDALSCIAQLGAEGCGFEAPLEAMKRALDGSRPENAGFLRKNAFLAVVFLVDEDDASVADRGLFTPTPQSDFPAQPLFAYQCDQPISSTAAGNYTNCRPRTGAALTDTTQYFEFLQALKPPGRTVVAVIGGEPNPNIGVGPLTIGAFQQPLALLPSCTATINGNPAMARPALRLADFASKFADRGLFRTVCQPDYSQTLADIGALINTAVKPCLEGPIDATDRLPDPGLQIDCNVSDVVLEPEEDETVIQRCEMLSPEQPSPGGARPCWWVKQNPASCGGTATQLELHLERTQTPAPGTSVRARCATSNT